MIETDYATLIRHPERPDEEQRKEMTAGSILYAGTAAAREGKGEPNAGDAEPTFAEAGQVQLK